MSGVWDSFAQGLEIGTAMRARREQRQRTADYGHAFQEGGWSGVAQTAGAQGDLQTADAAQGNDAQQQQGVLQHAQRTAAVLSNVATSMQSLPYDQRRQRIEQMAPMLAQMGIPQDQIAGFDPTDENLANVRALDGHFSQYQDIRTGQNGEILGVLPNGQVQVLHQPEPQWQTNGTTPYRVTPDGEVQTGQGEIPHVPSAVQGVTLSPEAQDFVAQQYLSGQDIPTGISRGRNIGPVIERATQMAGERHMSPQDVGVNRAAYQSARGAWQQMQRTRSMVASFETTALQNLQIAEEYSGRVDRTGLPVLNRWIQGGQRELAGDPDVAAFHTAVNTFVMEYAKIMSGATGSAGATEGARTEAMTLLSTAHTPAQFRAIVGVMRRDMHNRALGFEREEQQLREQMRSMDGQDGPHGDNHARMGGRPMVGSDPAGGGAPSDIETMTPEQLDELERQLTEQGQQ